MELSEILIIAEEKKDMGDKDWLYSSFKKDIQRLNLTSIEYQNAIQRLCEILEY